MGWSITLWGRCDWCLDSPSGICHYMYVINPLLNDWFGPGEYILACSLKTMSHDVGVCDNWPPRELAYSYWNWMPPCFPILWQCPLEVCLCSWRKKTDRCMCGEACIWLKSKDKQKQIPNKQCFPWNTNCNRFIFVYCKTFMYIKSEYDLNSGFTTLFSEFCNVYLFTILVLLELDRIFWTKDVEIQKCLKLQVSHPNPDRIHSTPNGRELTNGGSTKKKHSFSFPFCYSVS